MSDVRQRLIEAIRSSEFDNWRPGDPPVSWRFGDFHDSDYFREYRAYLGRLYRRSAFGAGSALVIGALSYGTQFHLEPTRASRSGRLRDYDAIAHNPSRAAPVPAPVPPAGHLGIGEDAYDRVDWKREQDVLDPANLPRSESEVLHDMEQLNARRRQARRTPGPHFVEEPLYYNPPGPVNSLMVTTSTRLSTFAFATTATAGIRNWIGDVNVSKVYQMLNFTGYSSYNAWNHDVQRYFASYTYCHPVGFDIKIVLYPYNGQVAFPFHVAYLEDGFNDTGPVNALTTVADLQDWSSQRYARHAMVANNPANTTQNTQTWRWNVPSTSELWGEAVADDDKLDTKYDGTAKYPGLQKLFTLHLGFLDVQNVCLYGPAFDIDVTQHLLFYQPRSITDA